MQSFGRTAALSRTATFCCSVLASLFLSLPVWAELSEEQILKARERGLNYLKSQISTQNNGFQYVSALAMLKSEIPPDLPEIDAVIRQILEACAADTYKPVRHHVYEAATALMCLAVADRVKYKPQIEKLTAYILSEQMESGGWDYPKDFQQREVGDTSITQFALLGLWEARRSDVKVSSVVLERTARWLLSIQNSDGGFAYHPGGSFTKSTDSMSAAGVSCLLIIRHLLYPQSRVVFSEEGVPTSSPKKFGVLDYSFADGYRPTIPLKELDAGVTRGITWLVTHFSMDGKEHYPMYYMYAIERMCALAYMKKVSQHEWYQEGSELLLNTQKADGSWTEEFEAQGNIAVTSGTSFAILFLSKATSKMVDPPYGKGFLIGGRGLPDDLKDADPTASKAKKKESLGKLDDLLSSLENPETKNTELVQNQIMDKILNERPEDLIGQKDKLLTMAKDPRPDVRIVAVWALGRTSDLRICPTLIESLKDKDEGVAVEASNSLRILSRQLRGILPPTENFDAAAEYAAWSKWYRSVRPYEERDDLLR